MIALEGADVAFGAAGDLVTCVWTAYVSRVGEMAQIQLSRCCLLWGHDGPYHPSLTAALAIQIIRRKQDKARFGLYVRSLRIPSGRLVEMLRAYVQDMLLRVELRCTKEPQHGVHMPILRPCVAEDSCGPLAGVSRPHSGDVLATGIRAVKVELESLGVDARHYSRISMSRGRVTAAVQAKICPALMHIQSGHGTATSSMGYGDLVDPATPYHTGTAAAILGVRP